MTEIITRQEQARKMLRELSVPTHHSGYRQLCIALPLFAQDPEQSMTKELYPYIAKQVGCANAWDVECAIRRAILCAWEYGDRDVWNKYFPRCVKAPSNMVFIATLAEYLR